MMKTEEKSDSKTKKNTSFVVLVNKDDGQLHLPRRNIVIEFEM